MKEGKLNIAAERPPVSTRKAKAIDHVPLYKFRMLDVPLPKSGFGGCVRGQEIAECPRIDRLAFYSRVRVTGIGYGVMEARDRATGLPLFASQAPASTCFKSCVDGVVVL